MAGIQGSGRRLAVAAALAACAGAAVVARLVDTAVLDHDTWVAEAERQQQRTVALPAERGALLDREGRPLAVSLPAWSAHADPTAFADTASRVRAARLLATVLDTPRREMERRLALPRYFTWLERQLPPERRDAVAVGSSRVDLQACKLEYSIVSPK